MHSVSHLADAVVDNSIKGALEKAKLLSPTQDRRKGNVRLTVVRSALGLEGEGEVEVGPIQVDAYMTVSMVEDKIRQFLETESVCEGGQWPAGLLKKALGIEESGDVVLLDARLPSSSKVLVDLSS